MQSKVISYRVHRIIGRLHAKNHGPKSRDKKDIFYSLDRWVHIVAYGGLHAIKRDVLWLI